MNKNEKNKRLLNDAQLSQSKIVSEPSVQVNVVQVASHRDSRENRSVRQESGQRLLRDASAFYKNDTSSFLKELHKAETLLRQRINFVSKIDFLPPKRKSARKENPDVAQGNGIDALLSDTEVALISRPGQKKQKNEEPEKLVVDVNDFVETFSAFRDPAYLPGFRKNHPVSEIKSEVESLLDQVQLRRDNDKTRKTLEPTFDSLERDMCDDTVESPAEPSDRPIPHDNVLHVVDGTIQDVMTHNPSTIACGFTDDVRGLRSETPADHPVVHHLPGLSAEQEYKGQLQLVVNTLTILPPNEVGDELKQDAAGHVDEQTVPETVVPAQVETTNAAVEMELPEAAVSVPVSDVESDSAEDRISDAVTEEIQSAIASHHVVPKLPGILERLEDIAGDQCDGLPNYIKDRVYEGSRLIAFCGMKRRGGCSTMTLLAAKGITRHGLKTAVIDANFEFPQLNAMVTGQQDGWENQASWVNILHGTADWESLGVTPKDMPLLTIFPLAENALDNWSQHEPERLQQKTNSLVSTLHDHFDIILLDCGCFEDAFEEITWGELALFQPDGVILVRNPKTTPLELLEPCCREILGSGIGAYGVAENFV